MTTPGRVAGAIQVRVTVDVIEGYRKDIIAKGPQGEVQSQEYNGPELVSQSQTCTNLLEEGRCFARQKRVLYIK